MSRITEWAKLPITLTELCLATTLRCGQSFRWKQTGDDNIWTCAHRGRVIQLTQDQTHLRYRSIWPASSIIDSAAPPTPPSSTAGSEEIAHADDTKQFLQHYLNLEPNLEQLYAQWSSSDTNFRKKAPKFTGIRILKQDAWEALICFICSSNNNIIRISQMVEKLCTNYGKYITTLDDGREYYDFPTPLSLTGGGVEAHLRELGFGYRAKYISRTAQMVAQQEAEQHGWLDSLRNPESPAFGNKASPAGKMKPEGRDGYREAHERLLELQGVGPKVADCVCLMGLGWGEAVPVDTHVWQIAQRDYKFGKGKHASLTKVTYDAVANHFRKIWGQEAGWAHSVLFTADLRAFSERLTTKIEVKEEKIEIKNEDPEQNSETNVEPRIIKIKTEVKKVAVKRKSDDTRVTEVHDAVVVTGRPSKTRRRK